MASVSRRLDYARSQFFTGAPGEEWPAFLAWVGLLVGSPTGDAAAIRTVRAGREAALIPWLAREFRRTPSTNPGFVLTAIRDWWLAVRCDIGCYTLAAAGSAAWAWHQERAECALAEPLQTRVGMELVGACEGGEVWQVHEAPALVAVGARLGHCYQAAIVAQMYLRSHRMLVGLRDGKPVWAGTEHCLARIPLEVRGPGNGPVLPEDVPMLAALWHPSCKDFCQDLVIARQIAARIRLWGRLQDASRGDRVRRWWYEGKDGLRRAVYSDGRSWSEGLTDGRGTWWVWAADQPVPAGAWWLGEEEVA